MHSSNYQAAVDGSRDQWSDGNHAYWRAVMLAEGKALALLMTDDAWEALIEALPEPESKWSFHTWANVLRAGKNYVFSGGDPANTTAMVEYIVARAEGVG